MKTKIVYKRKILYFFSRTKTKKKQNTKIRRDKIKLKEPINYPGL